MSASAPPDLDYDSIDYWEGGPGKQTAKVPIDWVPQFKKGEEARNQGASFYRRTYHKDGNKSVGKDVLSYEVYYCQHGPEDHTTPAARAAAEQAASSRASRVAAGMSIKVGCTCHFVVKVLKSEPEHAYITYKQPQHTNHDGRLAAFLSPQMKAWVEEQLRVNPQLSTDELQQRNTERFLRAIRVENENWSESQVWQHFEQRVPKRDWFLQQKEVANLKAKIQAALLGNPSNQAENVRQLVHRNRESVFLYQARALQRARAAR